jgi:hypothetical protein
LSREKQEKVTCGWPGSTSIILWPGFWGGVSVRWREMGGGRMEERGKRLTGNITHLMIVEHCFTPFVTRHIRHWVLLPSVIYVGYSTARGKPMHVLSLLRTGVFFVQCQWEARGRWKKSREGTGRKGSERMGEDG